MATAAERRNPHAARHLLSTGRGKQRMDAIRARFSTFVGAEQQLAARHADRSDDGGRAAILIGLGAVGGSALLILVYATYLFRVVTIPVRRVAEGARRLAGGALSTRVPERGVGEVGALAGDFNAMADSLGRQSAQLQRQNAELEAVLDATIDGILMTDAEGTLLFSNKKIERFWSELGLPDGRACYPSGIGLRAPWRGSSCVERNDWRRSRRSPRRRNRRARDTATALRTSPFSKDSRRFASAPGCTSARPGSGASTT